MYLFYGFLGFLQSVFLPGAALCTTILNKKIEFIKLFVLIFIYSITINYVLISLLLYLKIYVKLSVLIIILFEFLILWLNIFYFNTPNRYLQTNDVPTDIVIINSQYIKFVNILYTILISISVFLILIFYHKTVYNHIDAIMTNDPWAQSWANNQYPRTYGDYPQLMNIIMSIPYVLMGTNKIQLFSILNLEFFIVPGLCALYTIRKTSFSIPSITCAIILLWLNTSTRAIVADVHLTTLIIISLVILIWCLINISNNIYNNFYIFSAFITAAMAAVMKQTGLIWYFLFVLVVYNYLKLYNVSNKKIFNYTGLPVLLSLIICVSWYFFNSYLVYIGYVPTKLISIFNNDAYYRGRSFFGRAFYCLYHYSYYSIFTIFAIRCLFIKKYYPIAVSGLVFMGGWILFLSYGAANGKLPVILISFCLGYCIEESLSKQWFKSIKDKFFNLITCIKNNPLKSLILSISLFTIFLFSLSFIFSNLINVSLLKHRDRQVLKIGDPGLQTRVDFLLKNNPQKLLTCDGRLKQLGSLPPENYYYCFENYNLEDFNYLVLNQQALELYDKEYIDKNFYIDYTERQYSLYIRNGHR
jgi:hypothetical protein